MEKFSIWNYWRKFKMIACETNLVSWLFHSLTKGIRTWSPRHSTEWLTDDRLGSTFNRVVELKAPQLDAIFHALSDTTRRQMLLDLADGERTVGQLAEPFDMSLAAASKHVKALERAGLIRREVQWRTHICHLEPGVLAGAHEWLSFYQRFWNERLNTLEGLLRKGGASDPTPPNGTES